MADIAEEQAEEAKQKDEEESGKTEIPEQDVVQFLTDNPNPDDATLHAWAEDKGYNIHNVEAKIYELATKYTQFLSEGKAKEEGVKPSDLPADQMARGVKVEGEHTSIPEIKKHIASDHIAEFGSYYKELPKMEAKLEAKKAGYVSHLTQAERAGCIRMGMMLKLAEHNIRPSQMIKSGLVTEIGKTILGLSLVAGIPVGAAAHLLNRKIVERRGKERELQEKIKYYRSATQGLERGLADEPSAVMEEASTVGNA